MADWSVTGYTTVKTLGAGGFGEVVLARHDATGTMVAIKYLRPNLLADQGFVEMFRSEAAVLASLEDPNIVRLYEYVETPDGAAIVMELVEGVSLRQILDNAGATSAEAALVVLEGSLLGLAAAHLRGVVHRDYKPENVLVSGAGVSKLTDFGIAARAGDVPVAAGTLLYVAPEQASGAPASPASDVYSATATFYECLTGSPPFTGNAVQVLYKHSAEPVPLDPVPPALRPVVAAGMAKNPSARPADAGSFVTGLRTVAARAYGPDWPRRGRSHLGEATLLLAALWPAATAPATQGAASVYKVSLLRRLRHLWHLSPAKAAIAGAIGAAVVAGGAAVAVGLSHHGASGHRRPPATPAAAGLPGHIIYMTGFAVTPCSGARCWRIHEISPYGGGDRLLPVGHYFCCGHPALSPDGTELVFENDVDVGSGIDVTDVNGHPAKGIWKSGGQPVPKGPGLVSLSAPTWSPSGRQIAFIGTLVGTGQSSKIYVINADGTGQRVIQDITSGAAPVALAWSRDGKRLAFGTTSGTTAGSGTIAEVGLSGGPARTLVSGIAGGVTGLSWGSGPEPLFSRGHDPGIWEATGDGGARLVLRCRACMSPSWAPDGIHFAAVRPGHGVIVATVAGGVQATIGPGNVIYAEWGGPARALAPPVRTSHSPSAPASSAPAAPAPSALNLRKVDWGDLTIPGGWFTGPPSVRLRPSGHGLSESASVPSGITVGSKHEAEDVYLDTAQIVYGTLGVTAVAALPVSVQAAGAGTADAERGDAWLVYQAGADGRPQLVGVSTGQSGWPGAWTTRGEWSSSNKDGADHVDLLSAPATFTNGQMTVPEAIYGPCDSTALPSGHAVSVWKLSGSRLALVSAALTQPPSTKCPG